MFIAHKITSLLGTIISVTCAIILSEGKVLCAQRGERMSMPSKWELPGGKIEPDESAEACLIREIQEELNLNIRINRAFPSNIHRYDSELTIELIPFLCRILSGEVFATEHMKIEWVEVEHLGKLDWAAADIPIVKDFMEWFRINN